MPGMTKMLYDLKCDTCGRKVSHHYEMPCNRFKGDCPGTLKFVARVSGLERVDRLCNALEQSDWRPVGETLPTPGQMVIFFEPDVAESVWFGYYKDDKWWTIHDEEVYGVTHWMERPVPPNQL